MKLLGLDPGRHGAAALITEGGGLHRRLEIVDLPFDDDGNFEYRVYRDLLLRWQPDIAYVENVWPRSARAPNAKDGMGFIASNKFMSGVGALQGITACYVPDCHKVTPASWKRTFGLLKTKKRDSCAMAAELWPESAKLFKRISIDDGRAEAVLIASYGAVRQGILKLEMVR